MAPGVYQRRVIELGGFHNATGPRHEELGGRLRRLITEVLHEMQCPLVRRDKDR